MNEPETNYLLDSVDALTKPDVLTRYTGTDHDHDWLELVRPTTRDDRDQAKRAKVKLPRTVHTGEYWCPWCDETVAHKPDTVGEQTINRHDDEPLLDQLRARIGTTLGDGGTRGANTGGSPIDIAAFLLHKRIDETIRDWMELIGAKPSKGMSTTHALRVWYQLRNAGTSPVGEDDIYRLTIDDWKTQILDILDPPAQIPYMGQACPLCGESRAIRNVDGDVQDTVALWAFLRPAYRPEGSYGLCKACDQVLARDADPITLRQKMNGTIKTGKIGLAYSTHTDEETA